MRRKPQQWSWEPLGSLYARGGEQDAAVTVRTGEMEDEDCASDAGDEAEGEDTPDVLEMMTGRER